MTKQHDNMDNDCKRNGERRLNPDEWREAMIREELSGREEAQETIAGYIRLMQSNDKPVFINTKFIVYVEPTKIARYHYTEGSLITLSVNGSEGLQTIKVIEPCEVVMKAIEKSVKD